MTRFSSDTFTTIALKADVVVELLSSQQGQVIGGWRPHLDNTVDVQLVLISLHVFVLDSLFDVVAFTQPFGVDRYCEGQRVIEMACRGC